MNVIAAPVQALCAALDTPAIPWRAIALAGATAEFGLHTYVMARQAKLYRHTELPPALRPFVNASDFAARQRQSQRQIRVDMVCEFVKWLLALVRVVFLVHARVWVWSVHAVRMVGWRETETMVSVMYVLIHTAALFPLAPLVRANEQYGSQLRSMPASLPTWRNYIHNYFVMLPFSVIFGIVAVCASVKAARMLGDALPVYIIVLGLLFVAFSVVLYPHVVQPLFDKPELITSGRLHDRARAVAKALHFPLEHVFYVEQSRPTHESSAYYFGFGTKTQCVVFLDKLADENEMEAVLVRELAHWSLGHGRRLAMARALPRMLRIFATAVLVQNASLFRAFGFDAVAESTYLPLFVGWHLTGMIMYPVQAVLAFALQAHVHRMELAADAFAAKVSRPDVAGSLPPKARAAYAPLLAQAIANLEPQHLLFSSAHDDPLYTACYMPRPTPAQRIQALVGKKE